MRFITRLIILLALLGLFGLPLACGSGGGDDDHAADDDVVDDDAVDDDAADDDVVDDDTVDDDTVDDDTADDDTADDDTVDDDTIDDDTTSTIVPADTIFQVAGTDSLYGAYDGVVEIRGATDEPNFIRLVHFQDLTFPDPRLEVDYQVYAAWTGHIDLTTGVIAVQLQVADFVTEYDALSRTEADGDPVNIGGTAVASGDGFTADLATPNDGNPHQLIANETWTAPQPAGAQPSFVNDDVFVASNPEPPAWLKDLVFAILKDYHQLPFFDDYRDRPEFQAVIHYLPHYRTDFQWYRDHPGAIRPVNKWVDGISMAETMLRARGYAPKLSDKAARFDADMPTTFLNPVGFVSLAEVPSDPLVQSESGDGLLWNGCYLASQIFRWLVTGEQDAFDNWLHVLDAQFLAHDIPQDVTTYARSVRPHAVDGAKDWVQGAAPYDAYDWLTGGNNDMIQGLFYAYALSWIYLPPDPAYDDYRAKIAERARRLADSSTVARDGGFNEMKANLLAWLTTSDETYHARFEELWSNKLYDLWEGLGDGMFYIYGISDWSGQHLDTIGQLILQFLAQAVNDPSLDMIETGWRTGMALNGVTRQVLWPIGAYAFANPPSRFDPVLDEARWSLREFPYPKQSFAIDQSIDPKWCASPLPSLPWKLDWMDGGRNQGLFGTPLFERDVSTNDFVAGPFSFTSSESDWQDGGGPDFLHAYWLGRYYGVIGADE